MQFGIDLFQPLLINTELMGFSFWFWDFLPDHGIFLKQAEGQLRAAHEVDKLVVDTYWLVNLPTLSLLQPMTS